MKKYKPSINIVLALLISHFSFGQDYKKQFEEYVSQNDDAGQIRILKEWEKADNKSAELYVAYFNYYVNKSRESYIRLGQDPKGENVLVIENKDTTVKDPLAYMYQESKYDSGLLVKGIEYADKGILTNPDRLDIRFGKAYVYGETQDYKNFTAEIIHTIEYSAINKNKWKWTNDTLIPDGKKFMLSSIQHYQLQLYDTEDDSLLNNMKQIAEAVLKIYPEHVESLTDLSIVLSLNKQYDDALKPLLKAETIDPKDAIVLNNIAQVYLRKGDKGNAKLYYEKIIKVGDEKDKDYARKQLEKLK